MSDNKANIELRRRTRRAKLRNMYKSMWERGYRGEIILEIMSRELGFSQFTLRQYIGNIKEIQQNNAFYYERDRNKIDTPNLTGTL